MNISIKLAVLSVSLCLPLSALAHKQWLLPSKTVLPVGAWITVDAGVSTDPFYADHNPLKLDNLVITAPDGSAALPENSLTGKLRSTFDLQLSQAGTYKLAVVSSGLSANWDDNGQPKRWRGMPENFAKEVPADAKELKVTQSLARIEAFATAGSPNATALKPTGSGLELQPVTAPTDLYTGEAAQFRLLLDGKPAAGLKVEVLPGGSRYRNSQNEIELTTDPQGLVSVTWPQPGLYRLEASVEDDKATLKPATVRRASYAATFEVLSP